MFRKTKGHTLIELLLSLLLSLLLITGLITVYLAQCKAYTIQSALIHNQNNSRVALSVMRSDIRSGGYAVMNRYRIKHSILYRQDDHGRFQMIAGDVDRMTVSYDRLDNKNITGVSIALDFLELNRAQREYLYVAL